MVRAVIPPMQNWLTYIPSEIRWIEQNHRI
nr:MAG TPA: hypothetical protein [Caudoviricetes sp.]